MTLFRSRLAPLLVPVALLALAACGRDDRRADDLLRADLAAAAQAPSMRQQYASPQELGYPPGTMPGYAPAYGMQPQYGYPQAAPQNVVYRQAPARVVYTQPARRTSSASAGSAGDGDVGSGGTAGNTPVTERNTTRGAVVGAATGAAVGILTSRDKVKGGAVGAVTGAVLGGVIGSQIYTRPRRN